VAANMTPAAPLMKPVNVRCDGRRSRKIASAPTLVPSPANKLAIAPYQKISESPGNEAAN
jgi:hypothetical protein